MIDKEVTLVLFVMRCLGLSCSLIGVLKMGNRSVFSIGEGKF